MEVEQSFKLEEEEETEVKMKNEELFIETAGLCEEEEKKKNAVTFFLRLEEARNSLSKQR